MKLPDENKLEAQFAARLTETFSALRSAILGSPSTPPDYATFQQAVAKDIEEEAAQTFLIVALLLMTWFDAEYDGEDQEESIESLGSADMAAAAEVYAKSRAAKLAADVRKSIELSVAQLQADLAATQAVTDTAAKLSELLDKQLAASRAMTIAVTETTGAYSAGETAAATFVQSRREVLLPEIWQTEEDELVCPICGPLNLKGPVAWAYLFPMGPPAHPNCRCRKERKIVPLASRGTGQRKISTK